MKPMLATIGTEALLDQPDMIFEPKLDGIRALCKVDKVLRFYSRNERDITHDYPELQVREAITAGQAILDGEIVVLDEQLRPRFELWQEGYQAVYVVFDLLSLEGHSLLKMPLSERKKLLAGVIRDTPHIHLCFSTTNGHGLWKEMRRRNMEGIMAKKRESFYYPGKRTSAWQKIKLYNALEALVIGYTSQKRAISSLLLGIFAGDSLQYIGKVGTGFTASMRDELLKRLKPLIRKTPYEASFKEHISGLTEVTWVRPKLVVEVKYLEFTKHNLLRSPVFMKIRDDKDPEEITFASQQIRV